MIAWLAVSMLEQGRYAAAAQLAEEVIRNPNTPPVSRIPALVVAGTVALRRGDRGRADERLDEARDLAAPTGEIQRIMPVAVARAEAAWSADDLDAAARSWPLSTLSPRPVPATGSWPRRTGGAGRSGSTSPLGPVSPSPSRGWPTATGSGQQRCGSGSAARGGRASACRTTESVDDARAGIELLAATGAVDTRTALMRGRRRAGQVIPRGPREQTRANPAGLTARELEVLALLADGLTNAQLADRLFLSAKTVDHHVSSVLRKLGEPNRAAAAAAARQRGLLPNMGNAPDVRP